MTDEIDYEKLYNLSKNKNRLLQGAITSSDAALSRAAIRVWGEDKWGCDTAEMLADEILDLRDQLKNKQERTEND